MNPLKIRCDKCQGPMKPHQETSTNVEIWMCQVAGWDHPWRTFYKGDAWDIVGNKARIGE
jgi:hypothetical protein